MSTDRGYGTGDDRFWWEQELPSQDEMDNALKNLATHNNMVDFIFTHDAPQTALQVIVGGTLRPTDNKFNSFLENLASAIEFKGWYFGHHHTDKSYDKYHCVYCSVKELSIFKTVD